MTTQEQIDSFYAFASSQIGNRKADLSVDELYCLWRAKHPSAAELTESIAALRTAHAEMEAGDSGRPARQALRESCQRLGQTSRKASGGKTEG